LCARDASGDRPRQEVPDRGRRFRGTPLIAKCAMSGAPRLIRYDGGIPPSERRERWATGLDVTWFNVHVHVFLGDYIVGARFAMRTTIDIDEGLMRRAMRLSGLRTKKATVEAGLRLLVDVYAQQSIRRLRGKVRWEGDLNASRSSRVLSLFIGMLLLCSVHSEAQTVGSNARAVPNLVPIVLEMDWTRGSPRYGPDFIYLRTLCQREGASCECTMDFKVISSRENSKEFADYIASFDHGKVPVTYEIAYGQDGVVHGVQLVSVGEWKREKFRTNDTLLGVKIKFSPDGSRKQSKNLSNPGDCFPAKIP
jgi:Arc/MetJ family transcription regulator